MNGLQTDATGLLYMRSRYYNPVIRRFINQDVLFGDINLGISLDRFAFANGDPVDAADPLGEDAVALSDGTFSYMIRADINISALIGSIITNPELDYTGQCATAGQFLAGTEKNGKVYDVPKTRSWREGLPVNPTTQIPIGTLIAKGWQDGLYPNLPRKDFPAGANVNHVGIFEGFDANGNLKILDRSKGVVIQIDNSPVSAMWAEVIGTQPYDTKPTQSAAKAIHP